MSSASSRQRRFAGGPAPSPKAAHMVNTGPARGVIGPSGSAMTQAGPDVGTARSHLIRVDAGGPPCSTVCGAPLIFAPQSQSGLPFLLWNECTAAARVCSHRPPRPCLPASGRTSGSRRRAVHTPASPAPNPITAIPPPTGTILPRLGLGFVIPTPGRTLTQASEFSVELPPRHFTAASESLAPRPSAPEIRPRQDVVLPPTHSVGAIL